MPTVQIDYPDELLPDYDTTMLAGLAREAFIVRLYALGEVSSGWAASYLGLSRRAFLDVLTRYQVSLFDDATDVEAEAARGRI